MTGPTDYSSESSPDHSALAPPNPNVLSLVEQDILSMISDLQVRVDNLEALTASTYPQRWIAQDPLINTEDQQL